jgi:mono/diheme cytochrome c family protein
MPGSFWWHLRWKLIGTLALAFAVWIAAGWIGFPRLFQWYFVGYVLLALPFYLLLDAGPGRPPRRPGLAILGFFLLLSALLTGAGFLLPQYDPRVEVEKIKRLQQVARDREETRQLEGLRRLAEKQGLTLARAGEAPAAPSPSSPVGMAKAEAVDPKLVDRGKQVYDDYECYNCHKLGGKGGVKRRGPEMDNVGNLLSAEMFKAKILDPLVFLTDGYEEEYKKVIMPDDFKDRMGPKEIDAVVAYMVSLKNPSHNTPKPLFKSPKGWTSIPREFQETMPKGWWTDEKIIARGKQIYEGAVKSDVTCAACHGRDGQPLLTGARDFRDAAYVAKMSDAYWFWRLSAGVPQTPMTPMKEKLTEEEAWQVIAYQHTFSHGGKPEEHAH